MTDQADVAVTAAAPPRSYGWVLERTDAEGLFLILGRGGQMWGTSIVGATHFARERDAQGYADAHCFQVGVKPVRDLRWLVLLTFHVKRGIKVGRGRRTP